MRDLNGFRLLLWLKQLQICFFVPWPSKILFLTPAEISLSASGSNVLVKKKNYLISFSKYELFEIYNVAGPIQYSIEKRLALVLIEIRE